MAKVSVCSQWVTNGCSVFVSPGYSRTGRVWSHERTIHEDRGGLPSRLLCHWPGKVSNVPLTFSLNFLSFFPFPLHCLSQFHFHSVFVFPVLWMPLLHALIYIFCNCQIRSGLIYTPGFVSLKASTCKSHTHCSVGSRGMRCVISRFVSVCALLGSFPLCVYAVKQSFLPSFTLPCSEPMAQASLNTLSRNLSRVHDKHFLLLHDI